MQSLSCIIILLFSGIFGVAAKFSSFSDAQAKLNAKVKIYFWVVWGVFSLLCMALIIYEIRDCSRLHAEKKRRLQNRARSVAATDFEQDGRTQDDVIDDMANHKKCFDSQCVAGRTPKGSMEGNVCPAAAKV